MGAWREGSYGYPDFQARLLNPIIKSAISNSSQCAFSPDSAMQSCAVFPTYSNPSIDRYHEQDNINLASSPQPRQSTRPKSKCKERPTFILAYDSPAKREASRPQTVDFNEHSTRLTRSRTTGRSKPRQRHRTWNGVNAKQSSDNVNQRDRVEHRVFSQLTNCKAKEQGQAELSHKNGDGPSSNTTNVKIPAFEHCNRVEASAKENHIFYKDYQKAESLDPRSTLDRVLPKAIDENSDSNSATVTVIKTYPLRHEPALLEAYQRIEELEDAKKFCEQEILTLREDLSKAKTIIHEQSKKIDLVQPEEGPPWIAISKTGTNFNPNSDYFALRSFENSGFNVLHAHLIRRYRNSLSVRRAESNFKTNVTNYPTRKRSSHSFGGDKSYLELYHIKKGYQETKETIHCKQNRTRSLPYTTRLCRNSNLSLLTNSTKGLPLKSKWDRFAGQKSTVEYLAIAVASREGLIREIAHSIKKAKRILHFRFNTLITSDFTIQDFHFLLTSHRRFVRWLNNYVNYSMTLMTRFDKQYMQSSRFYLPASVDINGNQVKGIFIPMPSSTNIPNESSDHPGNAHNVNTCCTQTCANLDASNIREVGIQALQSPQLPSDQVKGQRSRSVQFRASSTHSQLCCSFSVWDGREENSVGGAHPPDLGQTPPSSPGVDIDPVPPALSRRNIAFQWFQSKSQKILLGENSVKEADENEVDLNADTVLGCLPKDFKPNIAGNFPIAANTHTNVDSGSCTPSGGDSVCMTSISNPDGTDVTNEPIARNYHQLIASSGVDCSEPKDSQEGGVTPLELNMANTSSAKSSTSHQLKLTGSSTADGHEFHVTDSPLQLILPTEADAAQEFFNHQGNALMRALDPEQFIGQFETEAEEKLHQQAGDSISGSDQEPLKEEYSENTINLKTKLKASLIESTLTDFCDQNNNCATLDPGSGSKNMSRISTPASNLEASYDALSYPTFNPETCSRSFNKNNNIVGIPPISAHGSRKSKLPVFVKSRGGKVGETGHSETVPSKGSKPTGQNPVKLAVTNKMQCVKMMDEKSSAGKNKVGKSTGKLTRSTFIPIKKL